MFCIKPLLQNIAVLLALTLLSLANCTYRPQKHETITLNIPQKQSANFKHFLGVNAFEWDFLQNNNGNDTDAVKINLMRSFGGFRHYMDWERIEPEKEKYTFNPTHSGGSNFDIIYQTCHQNNIEVLACLKNCPQWLINTYPKALRDVDNVPAPYGLSRTAPASYIAQAKAAFQFAARYGNNKNIDTSLVRVNTKPRWNGDPANTVKIGLGYVSYIECNNEVDKTWKGPKAHQSPEEYAANLSAFYDGDMGRLGKNAGVKNADPSMKIVMAGLGASGPEYVADMIAWCKKHRGVKADGSVNLCFDIINYHFYNNDAPEGTDKRTTGTAPELSPAASMADGFVAMAKQHANNTDVWITEAGYDIHPGSPQRAPKIGNKPALITQADWMLRSSLLYTRHGLKSAYYYMLDDAAANQPGVYATCGFVDNGKKRPVANYFFQAKNLLGNYQYEKTISAEPVVDIYRLGNKKIYVVFIADDKNRHAPYALKLPKSASAKIHSLNPWGDTMQTAAMAVKNGILKITATETPVFIEAL